MGTLDGTLVREGMGNSEGGTLLGRMEELLLGGMLLRNVVVGRHGKKSC